MAKAIRYCEGPCEDPAQHIARYTTVLGENCTIASCSFHLPLMKKLNLGAIQEQLPLAWVPFPQAVARIQDLAVASLQEQPHRPRYQDGTMSMADW